jgi:diguanylate cyclase (GGDEF)-like protein
MIFFLKLPKMNNPESLELAILFWSTAGVLLAIISNIILDNTTIKYINLSLVWVLGLHLLLPIRHLYRSIPALLISIFSIYLIFNFDSTSPQALSTPVLLSKVFPILVINVVGFVIALRFDSQRYHQYLIQKTLMAGRAQLKQLATSDSLTGIYNRRSFFEIASTTFDRFQRYGERFSFAILDLDQLKSINDTHGHPAGDHSLILLTEVINAEKRSSDMFGRLAGDEFGLILPNTSDDTAIEVLSRMKNTLEDTIIECPNKKYFKVSFSAGVTGAKKADKSFDALYRRADKALLAAKRAGGGCLVKA